jgi:Holliday junction resolvase RusA-like endonuclease
MTDEREPFSITVVGRPAPQGSKEIGGGGAMRESSVYLPAWRAAVKRAAYAAMRAAGVGPHDRPMFVGPVAADVTFYVEGRADVVPDIDKLLRSTFDALTAAGVWEDDARVVHVEAGKQTVTDAPTGAQIEVWRAQG